MRLGGLLVGTSLYQINKSLEEATLLVSLEYTKDFLVLPFSSKHTIYVGLLRGGRGESIIEKLNPFQPQNESVI